MYPPNSRVEALTLSVTVFGDGALGKEVGLDDDAERRQPSASQEEPPPECSHASSLVPDFQPPELLNNFLLFKPPN